MGPFAEDALIPLSALQHFQFCERQCALIHLERQWAENVATAEGAVQHRRVDRDGTRLESLGKLRVARGVALRSLEWGITGIADVVELHPDPAGAEIPGLSGRWRPFPVEHKRGRPKSHDADRVQLCAQALCLEEMLGTAVPNGALFYGKRRRRLPVSLDAALRQSTADAIEKVQGLFRSGVTPGAREAPKCRLCSLKEICMPSTLDPDRSASRYLELLARAPEKLVGQGKGL